MNYKDYLKRTARELFLGLGDGDAWEAIAQAGFAIFTLVVRLAIFCIYPISLPIIAWLCMREDRKWYALQEYRSKRLKADIHKNGRSHP